MLQVVPFQPIGALVLRQPPLEGWGLHTSDSMGRTERPSVVWHTVAVWCGTQWLCGEASQHAMVWLVLSAAWSGNQRCHQGGTDGQKCSTSYTLASNASLRAFASSRSFLAAAFSSSVLIGFLVGVDFAVGLFSFLTTFLPCGLSSALAQSQGDDAQVM